MKVRPSGLKTGSSSQKNPPGGDAPKGDAPPERGAVGRGAVIIWLGVTAAMVFAMVIVGGITRLTGSGLSMVEWRPLMGVIPPLTEAEWERVYGLYRLSPEFIHINTHMDLAAFKAIFLWEYIHRILGRLVGLVYVIPLVYFACRRRLPRDEGGGYGGRFIALLCLGGAQGVIGWWMVRSGLADDPDVSQYRLAVHFAMAVLILALLVWTILDVKDGRGVWRGGKDWHGLGVLMLLVITIISGAFVAGTDGGKVYNEYPHMGDGLIPVEYGAYGWLDAFENPASVQFHHRLLTLLTLLGIASLWWRVRQVRGLQGVQGGGGLAWRGHIMATAALGQFSLGLMALLYAVPIHLGVLHQAGAACLLIATLWCLHGLGRQGRAGQGEPPESML